MNLREAASILKKNGYVLEGNTGINLARKNKDDEYYTYEKDVEKEMKNYNFGGKVVYCCCDNPEWSNVYRWFEKNYERIGLAGLISSHYEESGKSYWTEIVDGERIQHEMEGNGDCTSAECRRLADKADVIVTNPPFSIFLKILETYRDKKFLMLCIPIKMCSKYCLSLYKAGKLRFGYTTIGNFYRPEGEDKHVDTSWFTNLPVNKNYRGLNLVDYDEERFPSYDNYDGVECKDQRIVPRTDKVIGISLNILRNVDPDNIPFEILGVKNNLKIGGKNVFARLMIKLK